MYTPNIPVLKKIPALSKSESLQLHSLILIGMVLTVFFGLVWFQPSNIPTNFSGIMHLFDYVLFTLVSFVVWHQILNEFLVWETVFSMKYPIPLMPKKNSRVAFVTAFVPQKEPYQMLEKTLIAMVDADYPHDTWVLDEGNDQTVKQICQKLGVFHFSRFGIAKYNKADGKFKIKTKGGNFNAWFDSFGKNYQFVAQLDVDFVPEKSFLTNTLGYFQNPEVAFVGTPQIYGNKSGSWIEQAASEQSFTFYGPVQLGYFGKDMLLFIGANHVVRTKALLQVGGYAGHITEDHLTGMKFYINNWKSVYVPLKLAVGEGPSTWQSYFSQQLRWSYGLFDILFRHSPKLLGKMHTKHAFTYLILQQYYFYGPAQTIGLLLMTLYFMFGISSISLNLSYLLLAYPLVILSQFAIYFFLQRFNVDPDNENGWQLKGRILNIAVWPIYTLAFISAFFGKKISYHVTPKGNEQKSVTPLSLFIPHMVLGTLSAIDLLVGALTHKTALLQIIFALLNTFLMYGFVASVLYSNYKQSLIDSINKIVFPDVFLFWKNRSPFPSLPRL